MLRSVRRGAALLAAPGLVTLAFVAAPSPATAAVDPAPTGVSATWLTNQLTDSIVHNDQYDFDDLGLSADVALGLNRIGGQATTVEAISAAIEPRAHDDWYTDAGFGGSTVYAGSLAKAAVLAQAAGSDATDFGDWNLITSLEDTVSTTGVTSGRVQDANNMYGDTNTFGQAYAAQALDAANSTATDPVTDFLLEQQCATGWFRLNFAERDAVDQTCDGDAASEPDTDATAIAVLALISQDDDTDVAANLALAKTWLQSAQRADGSFGGGPSTETSNANSTGLAGTALAALGDTAGARDAAVWVRAHQVMNAGGCSPYTAADEGAIAYDDSALDDLSKAPIAAATRDQFRRASAQALPVLQWAPAGTGTHVLLAPGYVRAGTKPRVGVSGAAPGEVLCASAGAQKVLAHSNGKGEAQLPIALLAKTSTTKVSVYDVDGKVGTATIKALGAKKLTVKAARTAKLHQKVSVTVVGLARGESVKVRLRGAVATGQANARGIFSTTMRVQGRPGASKVTVVGGFANRTGSKTIKVVR